MRLAYVFIFLVLFSCIASALDVYPEKLIVYTPKEYAEVTVEVYNNDSKPVTFNVGSKTITLGPNEIRKISVVVDYGYDLVVGDKTVEIEWRKSDYFRQVPTISGYIIPIKWYKKGYVNPVEDKIEVNVNNKNIFVVSDYKNLWLYGVILLLVVLIFIIVRKYIIL